MASDLIRPWRLTTAGGRVLATYGYRHNAERRARHLAIEHGTVWLHHRPDDLWPYEETWQRFDR